MTYIFLSTCHKITPSVTRSMFYALFDLIVVSANMWTSYLLSQTLCYMQIFIKSDLKIAKYLQSYTYGYSLY